MRTVWEGTPARRITCSARTTSTPAGATLLSKAAGTWPNLLASANVVPVVANGRVFVGSHHQLEIFGLTGFVTTTVLTSRPDPSIYGQPVTFTAAVRAQGTEAIPTGA